MDRKNLLENIDAKDAALAAAVLSGLYLTTYVNYLLFHCLAELFSIVVAACLFMVTWNSRRYIRNPYLLFVGVAYLFIGFIRDDQGYWNEIDEYIRKHSEAELTHGVCPKCAKIHYAEFLNGDDK